MSTITLNQIFIMLVLHFVGRIITLFFTLSSLSLHIYRVADKSLARPGRKQATATEDFDVI
jgi:hypothetical protein